ncbi:MAG: 2-oxo acid dehydrogenase subunit E2 [Oscillospiraceae bacterium]|nr:2-oxo acid dehydrogenase subunit E2 [Oscillospiraceae bacterium]
MSKAQKEKIKRGDRFDGVWLNKEPAMNQFMAYLYPNRADNEAYINEEIDLRPIEAYLAEKNEGRTTDKYTYFHVICSAVVKAFTLRPKMNRFISGNRMYQRKYLSVAFVVKKKFSDRSEEGLAFRKFDQDANIDKLHDDLCEEIHTQRKESNVDNSTYFMEKLLKLPRWVLRLVMRVLFRLDKKGKVPYDLIKDDPNYSSIFLTNLGSIDLSSGYHHLSNWGTCSCFVVIGKRHLAPECHPDGSVTTRPVLNLGVTLDERIADGYYYSKTMKLVKHLLVNPELLELPASAEVDYLPEDDARFAIDRKLEKVAV